jgi:hypothetical protein
VLGTVGGVLGMHRLGRARRVEARGLAPLWHRKKQHTTRRWSCHAREKVSGAEKEATYSPRVVVSNARAPSVRDIVSA